VKESWCRWVMDFPLQREGMGAWYLYCPTLLASREQERETLSEKRKNARWPSV
jgi:hypothetical protein